MLFASLCGSNRGENSLIKAIRQSLCLKIVISHISFKDSYDMKSEKNSMLEETMELVSKYGYKNNSLLLRLTKEIKKMDRITAKRRSKQSE